MYVSIFKNKLADGCMRVALTLAKQDVLSAFQETLMGKIITRTTFFEDNKNPWKKAVVTLYVAVTESM